MIKNLPIALTILVSLSACSDTAQTSESKSVSKVSEEKVEKPSTIKPAVTTPITEKEKIIKQLELITKSKNETLAQKRSISINGDKFRTSAWPVIKGATVYNVLMNEQGKVKGSFVVVLAPNNELSAQVKQDYSVEKIAESTFKLLPKNIKNVDMMQTYKRLMEENFKILEMEVDYSPIKNTSEF
mgnify:CR=1 FL=1